MKNKRLIFTVLFLLLVLPVGFFLIKPKFSSSSSSLTNEQKQRRQETIKYVVDSLELTYYKSQNQPLQEGDIFPILNLPVVKGKQPNWNNPSVITVGSAEPTSSIVKLYGNISDINIQKIHIVASGRIDDLQEGGLTEDVIVLDASNPERWRSSGVNINDQLSKNLGIYAHISAYLIDVNRQILYAHLNHGGFNRTLPQIITDYLALGVKSLPKHKEITIVGKKIFLDVLPQKIKLEIQKELAKPISILIISNESSCDICSLWLKNKEVDSILQEWLDKGIGIVMLKDKSNDFSIKRQENGVLQLIDKKDPDSTQGSLSSKLLKSWGVFTMPQIFIIKNEVVQGIVPYSGIIFPDKIRHSEMAFIATDKIINKFQ